MNPDTDDRVDQIVAGNLLDMILIPKSLLTNNEIIRRIKTAEHLRTLPISYQLVYQITRAIENFRDELHARSYEPPLSSKHS